MHFVTERITLGTTTYCASPNKICLISSSPIETITSGMARPNVASVGRFMTDTRADPCRGCADDLRAWHCERCRPYSTILSLPAPTGIPDHHVPRCCLLL